VERNGVYKNDNLDWRNRVSAPNNVCQSSEARIVIPDSGGAMDPPSDPTGKIREDSTYRAGKYTSGSDACDCSADDEGDRVWRRAADSRTDFKETDGRQEDRLDAVEGVQLAVHKLEGASGEQVCATIPADIRDGMKVISDLGNRCCDDQAILRFP
jgi:hypothetical protein